MDQTCMMRVGESVLRAQDGMCPDWPSLHPTTGRVGGLSLGGIPVAGRVACLCACLFWLIRGLVVLQHRYVRPGTGPLVSSGCTFLVFLPGVFQVYVSEQAPPPPPPLLPSPP